jgi:glycosyltransferase involved in cell wall biosynthesis
MNQNIAGSTPKVSVIIPAYNTAQFVSACLDSVFAQTFGDFEVLVVNDGSPDTPQLEFALQPYREKIIYIVQENKRAAGARNTAIRRSRGEFLAFLDSDDSWLPGHLASQMELFQNDPELGMVYSNAVALRDEKRGKTFMEGCPSEGPATFEALVVERCQIPISTVVARKSALLKAGLFDETLLRCDDYDMWLRIAFSGVKIGYGRTVQARLNAGRPDSLSVSDLKMTEASWKIIEKTGRLLPLNEKQRELVSQRAAEMRARYLYEEGKLQLRDRNPQRARELFAEANLYLRTTKLKLAVQGLKLAPQSASALIEVWSRFRRAIKARP